ncbi:hypothetical protein ABPG72_001681 [Tetrahymena utriculariae]
MADVREQRIYCAEQIVVPQELPIILKHYSKEVIRNNPVSIYDFSAKYFRDLIEKRSKNFIEQIFINVQSIRKYKLFNIYYNLVDFLAIFIELRSICYIASLLFLNPLCLINF